MQHLDLQNDRWFKLSIVEQMANIGSEIERAIKWREKGNSVYSEMANTRALELFDLTLRDLRHRSSFREFTRARELWLDFFIGGNQYSQTYEQWHRYIMSFTYAARNHS